MSRSSNPSRPPVGRPFLGSSPFLTPFALPVQPVLEALALTADLVVLELGVLACRFTLPIARNIATKEGEGSVYACDIKDDGVQRTFQKAKDAHLNHLVVPLFWDSTLPHRIPLESETVDVVIAISSPLFRRNKGAFISECLRVLYPGGRLFIAEWRDAKKALTRDEQDEEIAEPAAWEIFHSTNNAVCTAVDIPELEWAVMLTKSYVHD